MIYPPAIAGGTDLFQTEISDFSGKATDCLTRPMAQHQTRTHRELLCEILVVG
jgi:hypothetical protein